MPAGQRAPSWILGGSDMTATSTNNIKYPHAPTLPHEVSPERPIAVRLIALLSRSSHPPFFPSKICSRSLLGAWLHTVASKVPTMPVSLRGCLLAVLLSSTGALSVSVKHRAEHLWGDNYPTDDVANALGDSGQNEEHLWGDNYPVDQVADDDTSKDDEENLWGNNYPTDDYEDDDTSRDDKENLRGDNYPKDDYEDDDTGDEDEKGYSGGQTGGSTCSRLNQRKAWYVRLDILVHCVFPKRGS